MKLGAAVTQRSFEVDNPDYTKAPPILVRFAGEFLDNEVPETKWLVPGLVPVGIPMVLASKGGLGKSWIALQLCIAVATGKPFFTSEGGVPRASAYFGLEDSRDVVHKRIRAIVSTYKAAGDWSETDETNLRRHFAVMEINWETKAATTYLPDLMPTLQEFISAVGARDIPPGVIVLDTLARFSDGDENTVQALRPVLTACLKIANAGWSPLMLHHVAKGQDGARAGKDKPSLGDRMSTEWVRGSSAIVDNFRGVLQLVQIREDEADRAGLDVDKARMGDYVVLGATKTNGGTKSDWVLLEQSESGVWIHPADAVESLARIRGAKAVESLNKQIALLVDLFHAGRYGSEPDRDAIAKKIFGDAKDPKHAFRIALGKLRTAGFVQRGSLLLTIQGVKRVQETGMETERTTSDGK